MVELPRLALTQFEHQPAEAFLRFDYVLAALAAVRGGGTGLLLQEASLGIMGCQGQGKARKMAEIVAAAILGGEISMGSAIAASEFVAGHERYGRNRPSAKA